MVLSARQSGLGLRPFDASLIIAIAQDHTRTGRSLGEAEKTLRLVRPPHADVDHVAPQATLGHGGTARRAALHSDLLPTLIAPRSRDGDGAVITSNCTTKFKQRF